MKKYLIWNKTTKKGYESDDYSQITIPVDEVIEVHEKNKGKIAESKIGESDFTLLK
jgi:hypothetical protein